MCLETKDVKYTLDNFKTLSSGYQEYKENISMYPAEFSVVFVNINAATVGLKYIFL